AWLLGKRQRLWVMAAGALVELVAWALATIAWRVTAPETWIHAVALAVLTVAGVGTLFNFNPLLKFDGYYILSDSVEIPNLRQRAFEYLFARYRGRETPPVTARERRIFLAYGLLSMLYSVLVLGVFLTQAHRWVASHWGGFGVVLLWGTVVAVSAKSWAGAL